MWGLNGVERGGRERASALHAVHVLKPMKSKREKFDFRRSLSRSRPTATNSATDAEHEPRRAECAAAQPVFEPPAAVLYLPARRSARLQHEWRTDPGVCVGPPRERANAVGSHSDDDDDHPCDFVVG